MHAQFVECMLLFFGGEYFALPSFLGRDLILGPLS